MLNSRRCSLPRLLWINPHKRRTKYEKEKVFWQIKLSFLITSCLSIYRVLKPWLVPLKASDRGMQWISKKCLCYLMGKSGQVYNQFPPRYALGFNCTLIFLIPYYFFSFHKNNFYDFEGNYMDTSTCCCGVGCVTVIMLPSKMKFQLLFDISIYLANSMGKFCFISQAHVLCIILHFTFHVLIMWYVYEISVVWHQNPLG